MDDYGIPASQNISEDCRARIDNGGTILIIRSFGFLEDFPHR